MAKNTKKDVSTEVVPDMTIAQMAEHLRLVNVNVKDKMKKADVQALYAEHLEAITKALAFEDAKTKCIAKSFGSQGASRLCAKCAKKTAEIHALCGEYKTAQAEAKAAAPSRNRKMGHRTGDDLWGTRAGTMANKFAVALLSSGDAGLSMKEATKAKWNPRHYRFAESASRLVKEGIIKLDTGRYFVTDKGHAEAQSAAA